MTIHAPTLSGVVPLSLKDTPALIEKIWPTAKISIECQKERKAGSGQTLTALASYWKGRKPLILVRACVLGALLPATDDPKRDVEVFEMLMSMDDGAFGVRDVKTTPTEIAALAKKAGALSDAEEAIAFEQRSSGKLQWAKGFDARRRAEITTSALALLPYEQRVERSLRPEELEHDVRPDLWPQINAHLKTTAKTLQELVQQLGVMRYGHQPRVGDVFAGGGSIPFEAARIGASAYASDLNPIACMLTWTAFNLMNDDPLAQGRLRKAQDDVVAAVDAKLTAYGVEHDERGRRAKVYLYCLEVTDPATGWTVPLLPNLLVSKSRNVVAKLKPDHATKRIEVEIVSHVSDAEMKDAETGTLRKIRNATHLVYVIDGVEHVTSFASIRGDYKDANGANKNRLRQWDREDFAPRKDDILRERLYCIQWTHTDGKTTSFATPTAADIARERKVEALVAENLEAWQQAGHVADMRIEPGDKTSEPIRTRGWTHWHHLFSARDILSNALLQEEIAKSDQYPIMRCMFAKTLDYSSKIASWAPQAEKVNHTFSNQALNTFYNWPSRGLNYRINPFYLEFKGQKPMNFDMVINRPAKMHAKTCEIYVTDPPYADAVHYHEITEFFISWLRGGQKGPHAMLTWDSRRDLAIKGEGDDFRRDMIEAYKAMADHMPDNGMQIVMFTHQSDSVFADMARIFIAAGLQVKMAWYISTETMTELKQGGFVQGTVILVLRKRLKDARGYKDEMARDIEDEVEAQIKDLIGFNQDVSGSQRIANMYNDADLRLAGHAAALRVITSYTDVEGINIPSIAKKTRAKGEKDVVDDLVSLASTLAAEYLVPEGLSPQIWKRMDGAERFYLQMLQEEGRGRPQLAVFQNNAKVFRVADGGKDMMGDLKPNTARLKTAAEFKKSGFDLPGFGKSLTRAVLYAMWEVEREIDTTLVTMHLRENVEDYMRRRGDAVATADFIASQRDRSNPAEARLARIVADLMRNDRL